MDYEVIEMQKMDPVPIHPHVSNRQNDAKNVIYIENDDLLDNNIKPDVQDMEKGRQIRKPNLSSVSSIISNIDSPKG
jgi:hypothetical protein